MSAEGTSRAGRGAGSWVVVSPHLDDAVFSCGRAIAAHPGSIVVTVFAGFPEHGDQLTGWDARCGFASAAEAIAVRRQEDRSALGMLGALPRWLDFCDSQYGATPALRQVAEALAAALREIEPTVVLYPFGLFHSDHLLVHDACVEALAIRPAETALVYEDALYRALPGLLQQRLLALASAGVQATPVPCAAGRERAASKARAKAKAVAAYASQLRAFGASGYADTRQPERCWRLSRTAADTGGAHVEH